MLKPGEVLHQKRRTFNMRLLDRNGTKVASLRADKIVYATMTDTDLALLELNANYSQIRQQTGVEALTLSDHRPAVGVAIEIPSGYWERTYSCMIDGFVNRLKEGDWMFTDSIRYSESGCEVVGGTSGSPIVSVSSGEVIGINNTGNESGRRCTINNPCEIDETGAITVLRGRGYGQQTYTLYSCLSATAVFDLSLPGCVLPKP
jgi:hypothetical protein